MSKPDKCRMTHVAPPTLFLYVVLTKVFKVTEMKVDGLNNEVDRLDSHCQIHRNLQIFVE
jgi:hypothetical protein